jgi:hypothetical protein
MATKEMPVTEAQWVTCDDPDQMLVRLGPDASPRKLQLFACACCRRLFRLFPNALIRRLVEIGERAADDADRLEELEDADADVACWLESRRGAMTPATHTFTLAAPRTQSESSALHVAHSLIHGRRRDRLGYARETSRRVALCVHAAANHRGAIRSAAVAEVIATARATWRVAALARLVERRAQAANLRDIFGNPPQQMPQSYWLTPHIKSLAEAIYGDNAFERVANIAEALEKAGCTDAELLGHLRGPGPHIRGCWAVDLLTGRE